MSISDKIGVVNTKTGNNCRIINTFQKSRPTEALSRPQDDVRPFPIPLGRTKNTSYYRAGRRVWDHNEILGDVERGRSRADVVENAKTILLQAVRGAFTSPGMCESPKTGLMVHLERGQALISVRQTVKTYGISRKNIRSALKSLKKDGLIKYVGLRAGTVIDVTWYERYFDSSVFIPEKSGPPQTNIPPNPPTMTIINNISMYKPSRRDLEYNYIHNRERKRFLRNRPLWDIIKKHGLNGLGALKKTHELVMSLPGWKRDSFRTMADLAGAVDGKDPVALAVYLLTDPAARTPTDRAIKIAKDALLPDPQKNTLGTLETGFFNMRDVERDHQRAQEQNRIKNMGIIDSWPRGNRRGRGGCLLGEQRGPGRGDS